MIKSLFMSVSIPDVNVHDVMFYAFKSNADKIPLVSTMFPIKYK